MRMRPEPQSVLRWTFRRGQEFLTCVVHRQARAMRVSLVPHGERHESAVHSVPTLFAALQRHAAIAAGLREEGWTVVSYSGNPLTPESRPRSVAA